MNVNLTELLRGALHELQCDPDCIKDFNHHSTIELSFKTLPTIYVAAEGDRVWFWSSLMDFDEALRPERSVALISVAAELCEWSEMGSVVLGRVDDRLEMRALISSPFLTDARRFADALEGFYARLSDAANVHDR
jgi:hypothetical protein